MVKRFVQLLPTITPKGRERRKAPVSLRTVSDELKYNKAKKRGHTRPFLEEPRLREWKYWAVIDNDFPYSTAFKVHHMLIPKRVVDESNLNAVERKEMDVILEEIDREGFYDCMLLNFTRKQSRRNHFHLHLLTYKDSRVDMTL